MNHTFFEGLQGILAAERLNAYSYPGAAPAVILGRYLWNMDICESLYSPLQIAEVGLRNSLHKALSDYFQNDRWFETAGSKLTDWQRDQIGEGIKKLTERNKEVTPGRIVSELQFGFWTGFFNNAHSRTGLGFALPPGVFPYAPSEEHALKRQIARWKKIRDLRNRVFHHERILHWKDLDQQHTAIIEVIGWISPELQELAVSLDRYTQIRSQGLNPWVDKIRHHWPSA